MKKLSLLILFFALVLNIQAQFVKGTIVVDVPGAASQQALRDSIAKLSKQIAALKIMAVKGDKGDKGDPGRDGLNGKDGINIITTGGGGGTNLFSIKSVREFGAKADGSDDYAAIQKGIDYCIDNNVRVLFIPIGTYHISKPLIVFRANRYVTLEILGETSFWESNQGSIIVPDFTNSFVFGLQNNKGSKIRKLRIDGKFQPPSSNDRNKFFNTSFEDFKDGICRDTRVSPYSAIVIDPFTNLPGQMPAEAGYPGLISYYGASPLLSSQTGSTGIEIEEMIINNFVVGILSSPNGVTRNAEITIINKIQFENCKLCIGSCQAQEKANVVSNIYCWGGTHTIFGAELYGAYGSGNWNIDHANIAGAVVRFIYNNQSAWFPNYVAHVFAESLGYWGTINSAIACSISDSHIDFEFDEVGNPRYKGSMITSYGENVSYRSCNFRYYNGVYPSAEIKVEGNPYFDHCYFTDGKDHNVKK